MTRAAVLQHSLRFALGVAIAAVGLSLATPSAAAPAQPPTVQTVRARSTARTPSGPSAQSRGTPSFAQTTPDARNRPARPATQALTAAAKEEPIALGLGGIHDDPRMIERFAKTVGAKAYHQVWGSWDEHLPAKDIYKREHAMMTKATVIHFNLSEINWGNFIAWKQTPEAERSVAHTHHELEQVIKSPQLRAKTVFYMNGKQMNPCAAGLTHGGVGSFVKNIQQMQSVLCH